MSTNKQVGTLIAAPRAGAPFGELAENEIPAETLPTTTTMRRVSQSMRQMKTASAYFAEVFASSGPNRDFLSPGLLLEKLSYLRGRRVSHYQRVKS